MAEELDYVPMPANVVAQIERTWDEGNQMRAAQPF